MCSIMFVRLYGAFATFSFIILDVGFAMIEPFVVGGGFATITDYPHSAFLDIKINAYESWICGSSIINQKILLTAAHCVEDCVSTSKIAIAVGNSLNTRGFKSIGSKFFIHENYDSESISNDIALIEVKNSLPLGHTVKRVILLPRPLLKSREIGAVAGWGIINENTQEGTLLLKHVKQRLWSYRNCKTVLPRIPKGVICGGERDANIDYVSEGDSGSAFVVRNYIQVGIVSHKIPEISNSLIVYTDTSYFYDWISRHVQSMYCNK